MGGGMSRDASMGGGMSCSNGGHVSRTASSGGGNAPLHAGGASGAASAAAASASAATAESRSALEALLPPSERELLRIKEEGRTLTNDLVELRAKHYLAEDAYARSSNEVLHLSAAIERTSSDRAYLELHGCLPPPEMPGLS